MKIAREELRRLNTCLTVLRRALRQKEYEKALETADKATEIILGAFIEGESSSAHQPEVSASSVYSSGSYYGGGCTSPAVAVAGA